MSDPDVEGHHQHEEDSSQPDEEAVFREALITALVTNGTMGKLRAQLRMAAINVCGLSHKSVQKPLDTATSVSYSLVNDFLQKEEHINTLGIFEEEAMDALQSAMPVEKAGSSLKLEAAPSQEPLLIRLVRTILEASGPSSRRNSTAAPPPAAPSSVTATVATPSPSVCAAPASATAVSITLPAPTPTDYPSSVEYSDYTVDDDTDGLEGFDEVIDRDAKK